MVPGETKYNQRNKIFIMALYFIKILCLHECYLSICLNDYGLEETSSGN